MRASQGSSHSAPDDDHSSVLRRTRRSLSVGESMSTGSASPLLAVRKICERFLSLTLDAGGAVPARGLGGTPK